MAIALLLAVMLALFVFGLGLVFIITSAADNDPVWGPVRRRMRGF